MGNICVSRGRGLLLGVQAAPMGVHISPQFCGGGRALSPSPGPWDTRWAPGPGVGDISGMGSCLCFPSDSFPWVHLASSSSNLINHSRVRREPLFDGIAPGAVGLLVTAGDEVTAAHA